MTASSIPLTGGPIVFNPSFLVRYAHVLMAAYLATAFVVAGVAAWHLLKNRFVFHIASEDDADYGH